MTHKEMSEIFAVMLLAYPNAEVFKGGIAKLGPTINLWVTWGDLLAGDRLLDGAAGCCKVGARV